MLNSIHATFLLPDRSGRDDEGGRRQRLASSQATALKRYHIFLELSFDTNTAPILLPNTFTFLRLANRHTNSILKRSSSSFHKSKMPLVVPGLQSKDGGSDKTSKWMNDLMGKKIGDTSNETVGR